MRHATPVVAGRGAMIGARARPLCLLVALTFGCGEKDPCEQEFAPDPWFSLGESEYVPRSVRATHFKCGTGFSYCGTGGDAVAPDAAMTPGGTPVVVWQDYHTRICLKRYSNGVWEELDGSASTMPDEPGPPDPVGGVSRADGADYTPSLALDIAGNPVVAWTNEERLTDEHRIYLKIYDGAHWQELAGSSTGNGVSSPGGSTAVFVDAEDAPGVAWYAGVAGEIGVFQLYLSRFNGVSWEGLGGSDVNDGLSQTPAVSSGPIVATMEGGAPVVAWIERIEQEWAIYAKLYDGVAWVEMSGSASGTGLSGAIATTDRFHPSIATGSADSIFVTWADDRTGNWEVYLSYYDGSAWSELAGSNSGGGISGTPVRSVDQSVATDRDGNPVIAWTEGESSYDRTAEIYLKRFDGAQWVEIAGSARGGGVSNSEANSKAPALAISDERICVAWSEPHPRPLEPTNLDDPFPPMIREILMRCTKY